MEIPNEVAAAIYASLAPREKIRFGSTCSTYRSFVPEGFSEFARKHEKVLDQIKSIKYDLLDDSVAERIINGCTSRYIVHETGTLAAEQWISCDKATRAQQRRYDEVPPVGGINRKLWTGPGTVTNVYLSWRSFDVYPPHDMIRYHVTFFLNEVM